MNTQVALRAGGIFLVALAAVGFATVADDFRHRGEIAGVASILISGLAMMGAASPGVRRQFALQWVVACLAVGLLAGVLADAVPAATLCAFVLGLLVARLRRKDPAAETRGHG